ncbi:MAG TPA: hypothetical protein VHE09_14595 [Rhizomicrobium sp.]|nr:hypothetical protein [Rhizomicrobium sp.]
MRLATNLPFKEFILRPTQNDIDEILKELARTGQPEIHEHLYRNPIANTEPFFKLADIRIDRAKRPLGDMATCPMCNHPNKFIDGQLGWFFDLGAVGVIGRCCASLRNRLEAEARFKKEQRKDFEEDFLLERMPRMASVAEQLQTLQGRAEEAERISGLMRRRVPEIAKTLHDVCRRDGGQMYLLKATRQVSRSRDGSERMVNTAVRVDFGSISGSIAISPGFKPVKRLDQLKRLAFSRRCENDDEALGFVTMASDGERSRAVRDIQDLAEKTRKLIADLHSFASFFEEANFRRLNKWGQDPENSVRFHAIAYPRDELFILDQHGTQFRTHISPSLRTVGSLLDNP